MHFVQYRKKCFPFIVGHVTCFQNSQLITNKKLNIVPKKHLPKSIKVSTQNVGRTNRKFSNLITYGRTLAPSSGLQNFHRHKERFSNAFWHFKKEIRLDGHASPQAALNRGALGPYWRNRQAADRCNYLLINFRMFAMQEAAKMWPSSSGVDNAPDKRALWRNASER